jgi:hypothetical protein
MSAQKFDEFDRLQTIQAIERCLTVKLSRVGSRSKFLIDEDGAAYLVLGGYRDWHGIPQEILLAAGTKSPGKLVIAKRLPATIRVYSGPLKTLLDNEHKLLSNAAGDRQFNLGWSGDHPYISEVRDLRLELLMEIDYSEEAREEDRRQKKIRQLLANLSPDQREAVLDSLRRSPS